MSYHYESTICLFFCSKIPFKRVYIRGLNQCAKHIIQRYVHLVVKYDLTNYRNRLLHTQWNTLNRIGPIKLPNELLYYKSNIRGSTITD